MIRVIIAVVRIGILVVLLEAGHVATGGTAYASRASDYDGDWSVLILTKRGDCDRAYRSPVRIQGGLSAMLDKRTSPYRVASIERA